MTKQARTEMRRANYALAHHMIRRARAARDVGSIEAMHTFITLASMARDAARSYA